MARTAEDYGIPGLSDATLQELAGNRKRYGQKSGFASAELGQRRGTMGDANSYRAALEAAAYGDAGRQYGQGLGQVSNYLAGAGPLADSGAATALRARLASQIYGAASGRIGSGYAQYLGNVMNQQRQFNYQKQLLAYKKKLQGRTGIGGVVGGIAGGLGGPILGAVGGAIGQKIGSAINPNATYGGG